MPLCVDSARAPWASFCFRFVSHNKLVPSLTDVQSVKYSFKVMSVLVVTLSGVNTY